MMALLLLPTLLMNASAEWVSVSTEKANVRAEPDMGGEVLWEEFIHTPFKVIERDGIWVKILDYLGEYGWVHSSVVSATPTVIVTTKKANIRDGPGIKFDILWEVDSGYTFVVVERNGNWLQVDDQHDGDEDIEGWIHQGLVWGNKRPSPRDGGEGLFDGV